MNYHEPAILAHDGTILTSAVLSGYLGGRYVILLESHTLEPWTLLWLAACIAAALTTSFAGGTVYALIMQSAPRRFAWQDPVAVGLVIAGCASALCLVQSCKTGGVIDLPTWSGLDCGVVFISGDCLNLAILVAWGTSKSHKDTIHSSAIARLLWTLFATYIFVCGGGLVRDCGAIAFGANVKIGNAAAEAVLPVLLSSSLYYFMLRLPPLLQLGLGLPTNFCVFWFLPSLVTP